MNVPRTRSRRAQKYRRSPRTTQAKPAHATPCLPVGSPDHHPRQPMVFAKAQAEQGVVPGAGIALDDDRRAPMPAQCLLEEGDLGITASHWVAQEEVLAAPDRIDSSRECRLRGAVAWPDPMRPRIGGCPRRRAKGRSPQGVRPDEADRSQTLCQPSGRAIRRGGGAAGVVVASSGQRTDPRAT
jgi:hypothetical protein